MFAAHRRNKTRESSVAPLQLSRDRRATVNRSQPGPFRQEVRVIMADPQVDPIFPEDEPVSPSPEIDTPDGGAELPDPEPFRGDPHDGRTHDAVAQRP
jgi:hypothetical protein